MYSRYCKVRDAMGYRDADVARITGITPSTFSDWKANKSSPNAQKIVAIAKALNTTAEYLVTGEYGYTERMRVVDSPRDRVVVLTKEQKNLLYLWSEISPEQRENVNALLNSFIMQKNGSSDSQQAEEVS